MAGTVKPAVEAIWQALGMAPPPEAIGARYDFAVDETEMVLRLAADGQTILLEGTLGSLAADPVVAGDQLRRLLRLGLGLAAFNRAALLVPDAGSTEALTALTTGRPELRPSLAVQVVSRLGNDPREAVEALQDISQWKSFADSILTASQGAGTGGGHRPADPGAEAGFVIFQP